MLRPSSVDEMAVNCSTPFARFGDSTPPVACSSTARTPVTTAADMLVPDSVRNCLPEGPFLWSSGYVWNRLLLGAPSDDSLWPGAMKSGLTTPSYHVGPLELYGAIVSSPRVTVFL